MTQRVPLSSPPGSKQMVRSNLRGFFLYRGLSAYVDLRFERQTRNIYAGYMHRSRVLGSKQLLHRLNIFYRCNIYTICTA